jgi:flagellar biosynthesis GTPase FlhF
VPTRLLLEGRDLEELLAQVRDEHGPDAKIVSAEKIRSGGIGGLFSHPKYELTVEIQDSAPSAVPGAPAVATMTIDDLAAMADAIELLEAPRAAAPTPPQPAAPGPATPEPARQDPATPAPTRPAATGLGTARQAMARQATVKPAAVRPEAVRPDAVRPDAVVANRAEQEAAGTDAFAEILAEAAGGDGPAVPIAMPVPARPPGQPNRAAPGAVDAPNQATNQAAATSADEEAPPSVRPFRPNAGQNVARLGMKPVSAMPVAQESAPTWQETSMPVEEAVATIERPRTGDSSERLAATYSSSAAGPFTTAKAKERAPEPAADKKANGADRNGGLPRRLQALGVPTDVAFRATGPDTYAAVVEAFDTVPIAEPAPDGPGETLVIIGESTHAVEVCRHVAATLRLEADDIFFAGRNAVAAGVAGKRRITSAYEARSWAKRLRKADSASLVAIEAALDESSWAASIVEAVRPTAVWVVVDASRKTSDVAHHLHGLRRVDAIALRSTLSSGDPASPLSLRLPVALLDGRPATPYAWAAMLCERLSLVGD